MQLSEGMIKFLTSNAKINLNKLMEYESLEAKITIILDACRKQWPKFKELEPQVTTELKNFPHKSLTYAYFEAFHYNNTDNKPVASWSDLFLPPPAHGYLASMDKVYKNGTLGIGYQKAMAQPMDPEYWYKDDTKAVPQPGTYGAIEKSTEAPNWIKEHFVPSKKQEAFLTNGGKGQVYPPTEAFAKVYNECKKPSMWVFSDAALVIRDIQAKCQTDFNYHVCLGGGVLNKGQSNKDVDIYFLPMGPHKGHSPDAQPKPTELIQYLIQQWGPAEDINKGKFSNEDYGKAQLPYAAKIKFLNYAGSGKRIDCFIMGAETFDLEGALKLGNSGLTTVNFTVTNIKHRRKVC